MARRVPTRTQLLDLLAEGERPWHLREIATALGVDEGDQQDLVRVLDGLVEDGFVRPRPGRKFDLRPGHDRRKNEVREGVISVNARGFAFVSTETTRDGDVFIPEGSLSGAMHGDRVRVAIRARGPRGAEGEVVEVVSRGLVRVAGVLRRRGRSAWLEPDDVRIRGPIVLPSAMDQNAGEGNSGNDGDAAIVTLTRYPEMTGEHAEGKLTAVLGRPGELRVEEAKILAMAQVEEVHSEAAVAEAEAYGATVPAYMLEDRVDLTHLPLPTIDPEDARDHDDAVWVERTDDGGYVAWIAIADVSTYVRPGTRIDDEAKQRGTSIYLPDRAIPMLPRALSSNLCSLLPDELRLCLCVEVHLDAAGRPTESRIHRGFMKSRAKLHYGGVARALGLTAEGPRQEAAEAMREDLQIAFELSRLLRSRRLKRGALDFDLPDAKVVLDEKGNVVDVAKRSQDPGVKKAYQLIEELMLLANETVATWLVGRNLPAIFRIHEAPDEAKLERLAAFSEQAGMPFDIDEAKDPKALARVLKGWVDHPAASVFHMLLLRSMKQASYDVVNLGHFGLASKAYLHFTSPIRRYPDLVVHRVVHAALLGERVPRRDKDDEALRDAALASSTAERRAMEVERAVVDLHRAILMQGRIGDQFEGTVTSLVGSGVFVAIDSPFVDVLLRFEDLAAEPFEISDDGLFAYGVRSGERIARGDRLVVAITDAAVLRRTVYGRRVAHLGGYADEGRPRRRRAQVVEAPPRRVAKQKPVREAAPRRAPSRKATASKGGRGKGGKGKGGRR